MDLDSELAEELLSKGFGSPDLDYKSGFDGPTRAWMEVAKDIYGMANYGGGYIVFGVEDGTFSPIGMDQTFQKDIQEWIDRVSKWATGKINLWYIEYIKSKVDGKFKLRSGEEKLAFLQAVQKVG